MTKFRQSVFKMKRSDFRPADRLEPEFEQLKRELGDLAKNDEDVITYALFPQVGRQYLENKYKPTSINEEPIKIQARYSQSLK